MLSLLRTRAGLAFQCWIGDTTSRMALILAFESSCDETAVALVRDGREVVSERIASQADVFAEWGGVVPEIAARGHVGYVPVLVEQVLSEAAVQRTEIDAIAVAAWPGLIGSLLCSFTCAKVCALEWDKPFITVDHVQAHLAAVHLNRDVVSYPLVGLVASGGHSHFYLQQSPGEGRLLGGTIDDAAGEAYDKAASMLELGYPGGPLVDALAQEGNPRALSLPRSFLRDDAIKLSFSGLKTSLLYKVKGPKGKQDLALDAQGLRDACASFQAAVVDSLSGKLIQAAEQQEVSTIAVGGGVACNSGLRTRLQIEADKRSWELLLPEPKHCVDNAAMVGALAEDHYQRGVFAEMTAVPLPTGARGPRQQQ